MLRAPAASLAAVGVEDSTEEESAARATVEVDTHLDNREEDEAAPVVVAVVVPRQATSR